MQKWIHADNSQLEMELEIYLGYLRCFLCYLVLKLLFVRSCLQQLYKLSIESLFFYKITQE